MTSTVFERVRGIAADVLHLSPVEVTSTSSPETIPAWDSVNHLNLILAFEQEFGLIFEPEEYEDMSNLERIVTIVRGKLNQFPSAG
jgi:acyl carrier protein